MHPCTVLSLWAAVADILRSQLDRMRNLSARRSHRLRSSQSVRVTDTTRSGSAKTGSLGLQDHYTLCALCELGLWSPGVYRWVVLKETWHVLSPAM